MRKYGVLSLMLFAVAPAAANNAVSKTYFSQHNWFGAASPERLAMARNRINRKDEGKGVAFEMAVFGSRTTEEQDLRDYFLPVAGKTKLVAAEDGAEAYISGTDAYVAGTLGQTAGSNDIMANYFNVQTATSGVLPVQAGVFQSELTFAPKQTVIGVGLQWQQRLPKKWWMQVSAPITKVKNDLGMTEEVINAGSGAVPDSAVANMTDAFKQAAMLYGKIDGAQSKWGVADVEVLVGKHWLDEDYAKACGYFGIVIPTGNKPKAEYLWEAVVGNNKHFGVMLGSNTRLVWKEGDDYVLAIHCDANARYLFENTQTRMLDLKNKPWGRYLSLVKEADADSSDRTNLEFGVNILTQAVKVAPHGAFTGNTALNFRKDNGFEAEAGFNLHVREAEEVKLKNAFTNADVYGIVAAQQFGAGNSTTCTFATISRANLNEGGDQNSSASRIFIPLVEADLDLNSAAHPAVYETAVYATMGMNWDKNKIPSFVNVGGSFTFNENNAAAQRWAIWGKAGISF